MISTFLPTIDLAILHKKFPPPQGIKNLAKVLGVHASELNARILVWQQHVLTAIQQPLNDDRSQLVLNDDIDKASIKLDFQLETLRHFSALRDCSQLEGLIHLRAIVKYIKQSYEYTHEPECGPCLHDRCGMCTVWIRTISWVSEFESKI